MACAALAACGCAEECTDKAWSAPLDDFDEEGDALGCSFQSVWGSDREDLYFAGGSLGIGDPPHSCALHFDGSRWTQLPIETTQSFWWVTRTPEGTVWFVGEEGIAVRWRDDEATVFTTGVDATLFGVWGAADDDVWAVGGSVGDGDKDVILHFDGDAWTRVLPVEEHGVQLFKVWGAAADDVWIVGAGGVILHYDGVEWTTHTVYEVPDSTQRPQLFTVHGRSADDVWAVGASATILHYDGAEWAPYEDPTGEEIFGAIFNGVYAPAGGDVCVVGQTGTKLSIPEEGAHVDETLLGTGVDLHGVWCDAAGYAFAAGGNYFAPSPDTRQGVIAHRGCSIPTTGLP